VRDGVSTREAAGVNTAFRRTVSLLQLRAFELRPAFERLPHGFGEASRYPDDFDGSPFVVIRIVLGGFDDAKAIVPGGSLLGPANR
jgi:hypothetical protein